MPPLVNTYSSQTTVGSRAGAGGHGVHLKGLANILITGGAGYIGSHTRYFVENHGHRVIVVDNLSRGHRKVVPEGALRVVDLRDTDKLTSLLTELHIDAVIHFAAYIAVGESTQFPELYFANNTGGSIPYSRLCCARR